MFDVITVGSATRDIFVNTNSLEKKDNYLCLLTGFKFDINKPFIQTGGGATNTAVAFSRLGLKTAVITKIGHDDPGHLVKKTLEEESINTKLITTDKMVGTALSIIIWKENLDRTVFVYRGASDDINLRDVKLNSLKTNWIYITALRGKSVSVLKPLLEHAQKKGIKVAMNPGSQELEMKSLFKHVDVLLLNKEEAEILSGRDDSVNNIIKQLCKLGPKVIAITDRANKVFVYSNGFLYYAKPYNVKVESTLGAGDAFCSGFVAALVKNKSIEEAINFGLLNSSSVIQHIGAKVGLLYSRNLRKYETSLKQKLHIHKERFNL